MEYRVATADDIDNLVQLRNQLVAECGAPNRDVDAQLRAFFEKHLADGSVVEWLAIESGRIVATAAVEFHEFTPSESNKSGVRGHVTNMYTAPEYRGNGIASFLLGKLAEEAETRGTNRLWLHASEMGGPVYRKFGFKEADGFFELNLQSHYQA